jgi:hypothetical protein
MSRGPGKVERRLHELLTDPSRNRWTQQELIREAFGLSYWDTPTEAQRVSAGRALRKLLAASGEEWRIVPPQPFEDGGRHLIRERPAQPSDDKVAIWAYRYTLRGVEWQTATIVRRTRTRCTIAFDNQKIVTDSQLRPIGKTGFAGSLFESEWKFEPARSAFTEDQVNAGYQMWSNIAGRFDEMGAGDGSGDAPPRQGPSDWACSLLGLGSTFTREDLDRAYRVAMQQHHPDHGGSGAVARTLVMARDALRPQAVRER